MMLHLLDYIHNYVEKISIVMARSFAFPNFKDFIEWFIQSFRECK